jgi:hypothetical protein
MHQQIIPFRILGILCGSFALGVLAAPTIATPIAQSRPAAVTLPFPEQQFIPKARIALASNRVNVMLMNKTNAAITYQAVGDTAPRTLPGRSTILLRGLKTPLTLTLDRQDAGLLKVTPQPSSKTPGTLEVTLDTTTNLGADATTLRIENTGSVFLY